MSDTHPQNALLAHPFRPFFLLTGVYGVLIVLAWMGFLFGGWPLPVSWSPLHWHSHEMLYGFVPAAIAGFVLTAMTNWTGAAPLANKGLLALLLLWFAGRLVFWFAGWLPPLLVALVDLAFLPVLAAYVATVLLRHQNRRNLILVGILVILSIGNLLMHIGFGMGKMLFLNLGQNLGLNLIVVIMVVIAGRIIPLFTANWLRNNGGNPEWVTRSAWTGHIALGSVALLALHELLWAPQAVIGTVALVAGLANGLRLYQWAGWRVAREPLLWILHLGYLWIVVGLLLRSAAAFNLGVADTLWQHALGVGAMGTLILGVMTRVAMGHTGRPLKLPAFAIVAYWAIVLSTVLRLLAAAGLISYAVGVTLSALGWILAFALFVVLYWPILSSPRADGRPG
ncbi:NnrS family protein [Marinimicrobium sp. ABcell2]|uniref:NnrS family protein n=1 Tax=Marinimicrobium sp. ABcell2 TaxID=3069751 RepID=UPI0027B83FC0|nr:NnrS family protein [Marinimicrobium sp. ABcell2]MDQ2076410.1 NnrS family protein [Marinimicrobium sp. ABcell2]